MTIAGTHEGAERNTPATGSGAGAADRLRAPAATVESLLWLLVLAAAALLRLVSLAATPLSQSEGERALQSWAAANGNVPRAWPGGATDAVTASLFRLFGSSDALARVAPAVAGVLLVASFWLLRKRLGGGATLLAACFAAVSPVLVHDSRTVAGEALGGAVGIAAIAATLALLDTPRPRQVVTVVGLLCFGLATGGIFIGIVVLLAAWLVVRGVWGRDAIVARAWAYVTRERGWRQSALLLGLAALLLACSRFGLGFERLRPAALAYWSTAFARTRLPIPWHYPIDALLGYGLPVALFGLAGALLVARERAWRAVPVRGLLLLWLVGGALLSLFMSGRETSSLLLVVLPLCFLGGWAGVRLARACRAGSPQTVDAMLGAVLLGAVVFCFVGGSSVVTSTAGSSATQVWGAVLLAAICLLWAGMRWVQAGAGSTLPVIGVVVLFCVVADLHGASAVAFDSGDEFLAGQRVTREGVAMARLLVANGGGISTVNDAAVYPLAWYLRDTLGSGGHGGAQILPVGAAVPSGFRVLGDTADISVVWYPRGASLRGMIRWWGYREEWGGAQRVRVQLVVESG